MIELIKNGEETHFPCKIIPNNLSRYSPLNEKELNSGLLLCGLLTVTSFQGV